MEKYYSFEIEDYIVDDFFIRWVLNNSEEDSKIWADWLELHPNQVIKIEQAKNIVNSIRFNQVEEISQSEINEFIQLVKKEHLSNHSVSSHPVIDLFRLNKKWISIAASLIVVTVLGLFYKSQLNNRASITKPTKELNLYYVKTNSGSLPVLIHLVDGTSIILKPKSTLKYPKSFLGSKREVYLTGEAFFEVHKDPNKPFVVHSGEMITRVVGTSFTIKAYTGDKDFKVVVNTGKVQVYTQAVARNGKQNIRSVALVPNEQVVFSRSEQKMAKEDLLEPAPLSQEISRKKFDFKGTKISEVINALKEAYQVDIVYNKEIFSTCQLTASLYNDPLYDKLTTICKAIDANFTIINDQIVITGKGCNP